MNTDIVHNKTNTYNSLSDLYGIQLFTDARMEETRIKNIENGKKEKDLYQNLFIDTYNRKNTNEQITGTFQERMVIIMNKDYEKAEQQSQRMLGIGILVIVLIFVIIWYRYLKKKKERMIEESSYESNYTEKRP